jgi:hypothetical protein
VRNPTDLAIQPVRATVAVKPSAPSRALTIAIPCALFLAGLAAILAQIGSRPAFAYNWENYTLWKGFPFWAHPSSDAFDLTDGLMTDSGKSWLIDAPAWLAFKLFGQHLWALRTATGIIAAGAVPLTWVLGRRWAAALFDARRGDPRERATRLQAAAWAGTAAALLPPLLPSWLLYARTATLVGLSVTPALLTVLLIDQVRRLSRWWPFWLALLQGALLLDAWGYAPIRFLYPMAIVYFVVELLFNSRRWQAFLVAIVVTAVALPAMLGVIDQQPGWHPAGAIRQYYNARGEQLLSLRDNPQDFQFYLRDADTSDSPDQLERALLKQNAEDLARLFLDVDTKPALTDYWNQNGRLMPWFVLPFVLIGIGVSLWCAWRSPEARLLNLLFWGFTLPMIATSKVHIGRLVFAIPFICIFAGIGIAWLALAFARGIADSPRVGSRLRWIAPALSVLLLAATASEAWSDYGVDVGSSREHRLAEQLESSPGYYRSAGGVVWISGGRDQSEVEAIGMAATRIEVAGDYQFVNLALGERPDPGNPRPTLYYGGVADFLNDPSIAPQLCALPWIIPQGAAPIEQLPRSCTSSDVSTLP